MEFQVSVTTAKSPGEAVKAVEAALAERKFSVLWHLNVNRQLGEKGFSLGHEVHILEVCSAPRAKQAIDMNPEVAYFLPCKIIVKNDGGQTQIGLLKPTALMGLLGDEQLQAAGQEVEDVLLEAVQAAQ
ncbi:MAG TPA: DUF302 domain-containing protein [Symbiobacteriaceae bacterium]|jgi:uncharacterized protein (DUF302 family)